MISNIEREKLFREAITKVCDEHGAEIRITDDGKSYGMHSAVMLVTFCSKYENDELVADFFSFEW